MVGGLHTLKKLEWEPQVPNKNNSIREYITEMKPKIKMWSGGQLIHGNPDECDFTKKFSALPDAVALDLDERYRGWKLGLTSNIAIIPAECFELVDGLIVYSNQSHLKKIQATRSPMNRFQAMARIMAILCEGGRLQKGSEKYKIARKLVATRIERLGPDSAYYYAKLNKRLFFEQIEELHRLRSRERF